MDDKKIFDLLEKIYIDVQETKSKVNGIENKVNIIETEVKKLGITVDEKLIPTDKALLDGYKDNAEHISILDEKVDRIQMDINSLTMKVSYNDNRIIEISRDIKKAK